MMNLDGCNTDTLVKGLDKSKLVLVDVTVKGKNGTFTRKQWKKASDVSDPSKELLRVSKGIDSKTLDKLDKD